MRDRAEVKISGTKPFSPSRCGVLVLLALGYGVLMVRGRYPWLLIFDTMTSDMFESWQVVILVLTLLVWPIAIIGVILTSVWGSRLSSWRVRDLAIVEFSLALLAFCCEFASFWLYESMVGLTVGQQESFSRIYATVGRASQFVAVAVAFVWLWVRIKQWAGKHEIHL